jgi:hypothetical protein
MMDAFVRRAEATLPLIDAPPPVLLLAPPLAAVAITPDQTETVAPASQPAH